MIDTYLLYTTTPKVASASSTSGDEDRYTAGVRLARELAAGFDSAMEVAAQFGSSTAGAPLSRTGQFAESTPWPAPAIMEG